MPRSLFAHGSRAFALGLALLFVSACVENVPVALPPGGGTSAGDIDYASRIDTPASWTALAARPGSAHLSHTEVVKVIVDRHTGRIYFTQTHKWPLHFDFAEKFLSTLSDPVPGLALFNQLEYHSDDRRFILANVTHYLDADVWSLELFANDELALDPTVEMFHAIQKITFFGDRLRYRPVSEKHEHDLAAVRARLPVVTSDEIFGKLRYQPLELGEAYGYLRVFPKDHPPVIAALRPYDLVVLGELPEDIPVVSGVISDQLQAPLGHINILCHNRATPNMALRGATVDPAVSALHDKLVHLVVEGQSYRIEPATMADAERSWASKRPASGSTPPRDDRDVGLPLLSDKAALEVSLVGAKASQLAMVSRVLPESSIPKALGLPFHAYARFLEANNLGPRIAAMLADPAFHADPDQRRKDLDALRATMEAGVVPDDILLPLMTRIKATLPAGALRFRSSTNAEDLAGFNGAGLYRSAKVKDPTDPEQVRKGLREVWASVWLWGAFEEREFYRIDHARVGMAILVQVSIDSQVANGVALTANPFNQGQPAYFINAQVGGGSVTGARGDEVPEQILYYTFADARGIERLSKSSKMGGADLLGKKEIEELVGYLTKIHEVFTGDSFGMSGAAVDVEFLVEAPTHKVLIVQARPYSLKWGGDRRWKYAQ
ncbi:MAG: PEP/pyruvate-binding domain-containing protein [Byssovorax sp.]